MGESQAQADRSQTEVVPDYAASSEGPGTRPTAARMERGSGSGWPVLTVLKLLAIVLVLGALIAAAVYFGAHYWVADPLRQAREALDRKEFRQAAQLAEEYLKKDPNSHEAMLLAARAYVRMGRFAEAEAYFSQVPLEEKDDFYARAAGLVHRKLWAEAGMVYAEILQRWPDEGRALDQLIRIRLQQERHEEAMKLAQRLRLLPGWEATGTLLLALLEFQREQFVEAAQHFEEALKLAPDLDQEKTHIEPDVIYQAYAETLYQLGDIDRAIEYAMKARDLGNKPDSCYILGLCYDNKGDTERSRQFFEEAIARDPRHLRSLLKLGQLALRDSPEEAVRWFERVREIAPNNDAARQGLIAAYRLLGQEEKARELSQATSGR